MVLPLLLRAASSSVVKSAAKNVAKKTIKNKAKDFIRGKGKKKSSARMGEDKSNADVRASTSLVPIRKLDQTSNDLVSSTSEISKTSSTSGFGGIENQLNSIVNLTSTLNSLVLEQYNKKKKNNQREKLQKEKLKKREREERQEKKIPGSGIVKGIASKAKGFNILGAIFNFLIGAGLLRLIDLLKGGVDENGNPVGPLKSLSNGLRNFQNLFYGFKLAKGAIGSLVSALSGAFKAIPNVLKSFVGVATKGISRFGNIVSNGFKGLLGPKGAIVKYFRGLINNGKRAASLATKLTGIDTRSDEVKNAKKAREALDKARRFGGALDSVRSISQSSRNLSGSTSTLSKAAPGFVDPSRYRAPGQARASGFQLEQARKALGSTPVPSKAGRLSGGIKGSSLISRGLKNAPGRLATRAIGRGGRESLRGISRIVGPAFKLGGRALSRIPIMGPLIVLAANLLDDEVTTTEAIYRSLGALAGGAIGAALVGGATVGFGAILGGIAGEIIGEYFGELLYIGVNDGGFGKVSKRIQNDISHALTKGAEYAGMVKDWAGKGFGRLYEGLPKIGPIRPNWIPLIGGKEIPTPIFPLLLGSAVLNIPKAFFSDDPMKKGDVKKHKEETKKETKNIKIGQPATLDGKPVFWAGDNYEWQSRESFNKLKKLGKIKLSSTIPPVSTSSSSSSPAAPLSGTNLDKAKKMHDYIVSKGYTSAQSKGIVANIERESTFNPTARSGDDQGPGGLFQWKGSRQTSTVASLVNSGDWKGQIDYALKEDVGPRYKSETASMSAFDASMWWAKYWERPSSLQNARNKHNSFLPRYNFGGGEVQSQQITPSTQQENPLPLIPDPGLNRGGSPLTGSQVSNMFQNSGMSALASPSNLSSSGSSPVIPDPGLFKGGSPSTGSQVSNMFQNSGMSALALPSTGSTQKATINSIKPKGATTGSKKGQLISGFPVTSGYRSSNRPNHQGIDIGTPEGTYIALAVDVEIVFAGLHGSVGKGYGNVVDAWSPELGLQFRLAHLNKILCKRGEKIPAGTSLGRTGGATNDRGAGSSTGPHLHFEVDNVKGGMAYGGLGDPSPYINYIILSTDSTKSQITKPTSTIQKVSPLNSNNIVQSPRTSLNSEVLEQYAEYENDMGGVNFIPVPVGQGGGQPTMMSGGGSSGMMMTAGGSPESMVNNWWKSQLLGFLYKQG